LAAAGTQPFNTGTFRIADMTPENFRQIEELYHAAREASADQRMELMAQADPELRREVESLLAEGASEEFIDRPAIQNAPQLWDDSAIDRLPTGSFLGPYRVENRIGAGGMGEVYKAKDERLHRTVAIKVLSRHISNDPKARDRFDREAKALAGVKHPNICVLYDVGHHQGIDFLVMEYVDGVTLSKRLERGPLPIVEAMKIAMEITEALDKAHQMGIVHRDLKPGNVMLSDEGAKLLDFGLAKPSLNSYDMVPAGVTQKENLTGRGVILGTLNYMAPEQLNGQEANPLSDIFALGAVLYEMFTGRKAFSGERQTDIIAAIASIDPPPPSRIVPGLPDALDRIISRCLAKKPGDRWQSTGYVLSELRRDGESGGDFKLRRNWLLVACGLLIVTTAILAYNNLPQRRRIPTITRSTKLTQDGAFKYGSLVTDGSRVYFSQQLNGQKAVIAQVSTAGGDSMALHPLLNDANLLAISPDRSRLLIAKLDDLGPEKRLWIVPATGAAAYHLADVMAHAGTWTPDGERITYANGEDVFEVRNDGSGLRKVLRANGKVEGLRWSPDGHSLRFTVRDLAKRTSKLWELQADDTVPRLLLPEWDSPEGECCGEWSSDGTYFVFESARDRVSSIWALAEDEGVFGSARRTPIQLTSGPIDFHSPTPSLDGSRLFVIGKQSRGELIRYDRSSSHFVSYMPGLSAEGLSFSPNGEWISYVTYPEGDLWRSGVDGSQPLQLTYPPLRARGPQWSPDGRTIVFQGLLPNRPSKLLLISRDGGNTRQLTSDQGSEWDPGWSSDGNSLVFYSRGALRDPAIFLLNISSHQISMLPGTDKMFSPRWSPDGRYISAIPLTSKPLRLFDFTRRKWTDLSDTVAGYPTWSRDSKYIYFTDRLGEKPAVKRVRIADGRVELVASLEHLRLVQTSVGSWFGLAPDESPLLLRDAGIQDVYALQLTRR
jgi:serine/threonine protein kinase